MGEIKLVFSKSINVRLLFLHAKHEESGVLNSVGPAAWQRARGCMSEVFHCPQVSILTACSHI